MRRVLAAAILLPGLLLGGCHHRPPPPPPVASYVVGAPWQGDNTWFYPSEATTYDATGIAAIDPPERSRRHARLTADGEAYDASALAGSHQTLQLPVIVRVENLQNGRTLLLRLNDRGPAQPGRLVALTPRAARLLGMGGMPARVRVQLDALESARLLRQVQGVPAPDATAAPLGEVAEQSLMPGAAPASVSIVASHAAADPAQATSLTGLLPDQVADPGQLWIDAGHFSGRRYAERVAAETGGFIRQDGSGRSSVFLVRIGPLATVDAADAALDHVLSAGVTGAHIVVE